MVVKQLRLKCFPVDLKDNDIILMCSDGLTNMLEDSEIFHIIKESPDIKEAAESPDCQS